MIENVENSSNSCKYCGYKFKQDIIEKIVENKELVICEFCGIEINIDILETQEGLVKDPHKKISNHKDDIKKNKKTFIKRLGKLTKSRKYSVNVIRDDEDFPQIFKENLIIVISRLIYFSLREWEQENNVSMRRVSLNQSILTYLASKLKPILTKRISRTFLGNLHNISIEEFDDLLKLLQKKIESNQDYRTHFLTFIIWLKKIVFRLISEMWEMTNLPKLQATILKDLKSYSFYSPKLEEIVKRDTYRKDKIESSIIQPNYTPKNKKELEKPDPIQKTENKETSGKTEVKSRQTPHNDQETKECGRCHELKQIDNFEFRRDSRRENGYYRNICKDCRRETKQIFSLKNKSKIILNIYEGKLKGKCQKCNTSMEKLPSLVFHHPIPELKSQRIKFGHVNWEKAMKKLEKERVNLECKNCHMKEQAKYYYKYERFIQSFDKKFQVGNQTPNQIEKAIGKLIRQNSEHINVNDRTQFKRWVRKYIVISKLYNGKCVACEQITIKNNLPGLQFHHKDLKNPNRKQWKRLLNQPVPKIVKTLKTENCVAICANCQRMIHSHQFKKNHEDIVESEYWDQIKQYYKKAEKNIKNFKFN